MFLRATRCMSEDTSYGESVGVPVIEMDFDQRSVRILGVEHFSMTHFLNTTETEDQPLPCDVDDNERICRDNCCTFYKGANHLDVESSILSYNGNVTVEMIQLTAKGSHMDGACVRSSRIATKSPLRFTANYNFSAHGERVEFLWSIPTEGVDTALTNEKGILLVGGNTFIITPFRTSFLKGIMSSHALMKPNTTDRSEIKSAQINLDIDEMQRNITQVVFEMRSHRNSLSVILKMIIPLCVSGE